MADRPIIFSGPEGERFARRVEIKANSGCWLWTGAINAKGYGRFGRGEMAHRAALRLVGRVVPPDMEVDHLCRTRSCVNPGHLDVVTHRENLLRGDTIVAAAAARTHCPAGHPLIYTRPGRGRTCRVCDRRRNADRYKPKSNRRRRKHLTFAEVAEIRRRIVAGESHSQIARALDISVATVSRVRNGRGGNGR